MRDKRFITEHRGGSLKIETHRQLIKWACICVEHVLPVLDKTLNEELKNILWVAKEWAKGNVTVGEARNASLNAIAIANELSNPVDIAIVRAAGHAVATAHMAEHALVAALYVLKAVKNTWKSVEVERKWQNEQLPKDIRDLVLSTRCIKEKALNIV